MDSASLNIAQALLVDCCVSLFDTVGVQLSVLEGAKPDPSSERVTTFIGYTGNELRGAINLDLPIALVARVHPVAGAGSHIDPAALCDWAGELTNQLLGRFKNAIARHGVAFQMSTPCTVWGCMSHAPRSRGVSSIELCLVAGEERLLVHFDALAIAPLDLTKPVAAGLEAEPQAEGDAMLFF